MATYLDGIVAWHRARAASSDGRDMASLSSAAFRACEEDPPRAFAAALGGAGVSRRGQSRQQIGLIAEVKRRSPSKGELAVSLDPRLLASAYEQGGARCLSVLTDAEHFGGSSSDLRAARAACSLPVLRKDFTVCEADVYEARLMGADAVLLIVAALSDEELRRFVDLAGLLGLAALVEVHDEEEVERALKAGASLVGVNQRDLHSFALDTKRAVRLAKVLPESVVRVAESGISTHDDVARLGEAGYDAVLVGEALVRAADPASTARLLMSGLPCG